MKVFKTVLFFTTLLCADLALGQQYLDSTSTWKILNSGHNSSGEYEQYLTIKIEGDTTIQSEVYHKLYEHGIEFIDYFTGGSGTILVPKRLYGLVREDSSKFYRYIGQDELIYDFTISTGDSVIHNSFCADTVQSVDSVYLGTTALRKWNFGFPMNNSLMFSYVEGVGAVSAPLGPYCQLTGGSSLLLCYEKQGDQLNLRPDISCSVFNSLSQIDKEKSNLNVQIYPNPSSEKIFIHVNKGNNYQLLLYHANGQLLENLSPKEQLTELNLNDYPKGIYWIKVKTTEHTSTHKVIKI